MAGFIFDMDGTLLDSIAIWHKAESNVMQHIDGELSKEQRDELNTLTLEEAGIFFHERFGLMESPEAVVQSLLDYMLNFYRTAVVPRPGVEEFVRAVYEAGASLCVLSSSPQSFIQAGLKRTGLDCYFRDDLLISAEDLGLVKRDSRTFEIVCERLGTKPAETWLFDDSWYALASAQQAQLRCIGVFSTDKSGTLEELRQYSEQVVCDFTELSAQDFLTCTTT